jgi:hypothetical protein
LPSGRYSITIEAISFKPLKINNVVIDQNKFTNLEVIFEVSGEMTMGVVASGPDLIDTSPGLTTIISGDIIRKLPIQ